MTISAATLALLMDAGLEGARLLAVVRSMEADTASPTAPETSKGAARTARWRARKAENVTGDVSCDVSCDVTPAPAFQEKKVSPDPFKETQPSTPSPSRPSRRKPEMAIPLSFPPAELILSAQERFREAGADLDAADQAERFRLHAAKVDRRARDWPACWREWTLNAIKFWRRDHPSATKPATALGPVFPGPTALRQAVIQAGGLGLAQGFLDRCGWIDLPTPTILAPTAFIADRLKRDAQSALASFVVSISSHPHPTERAA